MLPTFDFETYSEAGHIWEVDRWKAPPGATKKGLPAIGAPVYTEHPSAEVLTLSYDLLDGEGLRRWKPGDAPPIDLWLHVTAGKPLEAHNIMFEYLVWMNICVPKYGWPPLGNVSGLRCSMAQARVNSLPGALGKLGAALGLDIQKDKRGGALLDKFSVPRKPTKANPSTRISPADEPDEFEALCAYCDQDVRAEQAASSDPRNAPMTPAELEFWQVDQEINRRGLALDRKGVRDCIAVMEQAISHYGKECEAITGGIGPSQVQALIGWLSAKGVRTSSLDEEHLTALLALSGLPPDVRRVLEIRAEVGSASVKKVYAFDRYCSHDDRLRNLIVHHGARTGRPTGSGPQVLNLPKAGPKLADCTACAMPRLPDDRPCPWCAQSAGVSSSPAWRPEYTDPVLQVMATRDLDTVERFFGKALLAISGCVRGLLQAGPGKKLVSSDYSAIEAVVAAAIAGEEWRLQTFREKRDIYLLSASKITGYSYEDYMAYKDRTGENHPDRQNIGKVAELACLGPRTIVLTHKGPKAIVDVSLEDKLWDGREWVNHRGVIPKGARRVLRLDGVEMTPDHKIICGNSWKEARQLASNKNTRIQSRAQFSDAYWFSVSAVGRRNDTSLFTAHADATLTKFPSTIFSKVSRRLAENAGKVRRLTPEKNTTDTLTLCPTPNIAEGFLTVSRHVLGDAGRKATQITAGEEYGFSKVGGSVRPVVVRFSRISSRSRDGTNPLKNLIASTLTGTTSREICGSSQGVSTCLTSDLFRKCKRGLTTWSDVYDIAYAGPRNRFAIMTNRGPLLVHNCGYGGWIGAWRAFDPDEANKSDDDIKKIILAWRNASPAIVEAWGGQPSWRRDEYYGCEGAFIQAIQNPGVDYHAVMCRFRYFHETDLLRIYLPSGRYLTYHQPRLTPSDRRAGTLAIRYRTENSNPKYGPVGWVEMETWGSRIFENIDQAIAHCIQRYSILLHRAHGYPTVLAVYDENVAEVDESFGSVEEYERLMAVMPPWAEDWPIRADGGWSGKRYRKG